MNVFGAILHSFESIVFLIDYAFVLVEVEILGASVLVSSFDVRFSISSSFCNSNLDDDFLLVYLSFRFLSYIMRCCIRAS